MKVGIVAAMEAEVDLFATRFETENVIRTGPFIIRTGRIDGVDVVIMLSGIGKVNAAVGTAMLLSTHGPDYLINTGVAGGFSPEVEVGDIVISTEVRHYDADATAFEYEMGQVPRMPSSYRADRRLLSAAGMACSNCRDRRVHQGIILSGDSFIHRPEQVAYLDQHFPGALAIEMEGAAVAQTGFLFKVPFILIRSISDNVHRADNPATYAVSMQQAANKSVKVVLRMLETIH